MRKSTRVLAACLLTILPAFAAPPEAISQELQVTEQTLAELHSLKTEIAALQNRLDSLIAAFSERKGQLLNAKPVPFGGVPVVSSVADRPDSKPPTIRCAALTKEGVRCTRAALPGQRYCKQHALAKQK